MRILVLSDSHGMPSRILDAVEAHPEAEALIFLGDGERDLDTVESYYHSLPNVIKVAGNCDFSSSLPLLRVVTLGGKKIYCTHGHAEHVKYGRAPSPRKAGRRRHSIIRPYPHGCYLL